MPPRIGLAGSAKINTANRGISGYELISWDEAAQICADQNVGRVNMYKMIPLG